MARYRVKDDVDLRWNEVRRRITAELDLQIKTFREKALNELLAGAWDEFRKGLESGEVLELEPKYEAFVADVLADVVDVKVEREAA